MWGGRGGGYFTGVEIFLSVNIDILSGVVELFLVGLRNFRGVGKLLRFIENIQGVEKFSGRVKNFFSGGG